MQNKVKKQKAVITGMGIISPLGENINEYWTKLEQGVSGIGPMTLCDPSEFPSKIAGEVNTFDPITYIDKKEAKRMARFSQMAVAAANLAIENASITFTKDELNRTAVIIGNGNGGFPELEQNARAQVLKGETKVSPYFIPMILPNMAAANISRIFGFKGFSSTVVTACAASTQSIGDAALLINNEMCDIVLAGGCESGITKLGLGGFSALRALSTQNEEPTKASKPFDIKRDGFVPAEGAGMFIIESEDHAIKRGANILCEIVGMGVSSDAHHPVQPDPSGEGAILSMQRALDNANITNEEIDYINAHGTSTPLNDICETNALKKLFKEHAYKVPISSTKSMIGHVLGGAGALEGIATVLSIINQKAHPTINLENPDPECDLNYVPNKSANVNINYAMSNNFGFGGQNASIIFRKPN
ncbi:MAG: beta-ketoacyl-[acyl-carrier-protein] synthase II [Chloroflexi bacterium]|nr:beta-ketoacyl-[acyl-carrier-protein] synthase II [Chloroflexota bacterium]MDC0047328.1 beta-ketoacyl-ACP synthase II [Chloroflexota bacterium]